MPSRIEEGKRAPTRCRLTTLKRGGWLTGGCPFLFVFSFLGWCGVRSLVKDRVIPLNEKRVMCDMCVCVNCDWMCVFANVVFFFLYLRCQFEKGLTEKFGDM